MIVVDTNVISEMMSDQPAAAVGAWAAAQSGRELFTTAVTIAEIRYGIERLPNGHRRTQLQAKAIDAFDAFDGRVLPFDERSAEHYAGVLDIRTRKGRPMYVLDAQIAAICRTHSATLATRNIKDFEHTGVDVVDPWAHD